jgi:hypothetical protein
MTNVRFGTIGMMLASLVCVGVTAFAAQRDPGENQGRLLRRPATPQPPDVLAHESHISAVWVRRYAACDCGWEGRRRWFRSSAVHDAVVHFAATRHQFTG